MAKNFVKPKRQAVRLSEESLVHKQVAHGGKLGLVITPALSGVDLIEWAAKHRESMQQDLDRHGALLFRGFELGGLDGFQHFMAAASEDPMEYTYRSTPRSTVKGNIYTTTEYPPDETIPMHNENSYQSSWPSKLFLFCIDAADEGGETPLADSARVYEGIEPSVREEFERKGVMYVRNYRDYMDLPWQKVFQTEDRSEVEAFCERVGIQYEWAPDGLRTRQIRPATLDHPRTGEKLWFNQAHLFHVTALKPEIEERLLALYGEANLPRHTFYGDGSSIGRGALDEIRRVYDAEIVKSPWQDGDLVVVDNMKVAHGRSPYRGTRKVVIGMTELYPAGS